MHLMTPAVIEARPSECGTWFTRVWFLASKGHEVGEAERPRADLESLLLATEVLACHLPVEDACLDVPPLAPWGPSPVGAAMVLNSLGAVDLTLGNRRREEQRSASSHCL